MRDFLVSDLWFIIGLIPMTLALSLVSLIGGLFLGIPLAVARSARAVWLRVPALVIIRTVQGMPLLVILMIAYFAPPVLLGHDVEVWTAATLGLSINAAVYAAEILRGAIASVPRGQLEAAEAMALSRFAILTDVVLPQSLKYSVAPMIGLAISLIKGTSIASILGMTELTKAALRVNQATFEPVPAFGLVCLCYFLICWPLSFFGQRYEASLVASK
ncbi:amino acid ABC transporter permease (plasmid) [Rhizobium sp. RCAM05350]|uniref:amino acid ABC transporter permease n=1 Tax=Rhizobium sp. RCAM05350 TaxID=2895568 RepID=UPI00207687CB|nr:amino acid ABC transporter permease [Rhizobium sp. RCAM05350]URK89403.1 amino acid ABC transporter permease [Rhizobium sp. RCAM05350]